MPKKEKFIACVPRALPTEDWDAAAATAVEIQPANAPEATGLSLLGLSDKILSELFKKRPGRPSFISGITGKLWKDPSGTIKLGVYFLDRGSPTLNKKVLDYANKWGLKSAIEFHEATRENAQCRLSYGPGGYYSYLGTDNLHISSAEHTMNLEGFSLKTPDSEFDRVVCHEFGHLLGFPHEHMRPELVDQLDPAKTVEYFRRTQGWKPSETKAQVLTPLGKKSIIGTPVDATSIMCYQLPGSITKTGKPIPGGMRINETDHSFVAKQWPKADCGNLLAALPTRVGTLTIDFAAGKVYYPKGGKPWKVEGV